MSTIAERATAQGFSLQVSRRVAKGRKRDSTNALYDSKWSIFSLWCDQRNLDPLSIPVTKVCDFFLHLFDAEKLAPVTIDGYRSAINSVWSIDGQSLLNSVHVEQLLNSFKAETSFCSPGSQVGSQPGAEGALQTSVPSDRIMRTCFSITENGLPAVTGFSQA
jgi:hypothetical protein